MQAGDPHSADEGNSFAQNIDFSARSVRPRGAYAFACAAPVCV